MRFIEKISDRLAGLTVNRETRLELRRSKSPFQRLEKNSYIGQEKSGVPVVILEQKDVLASMYGTVSLTREELELVIHQAKEAGILK